MTTVLIIEQRNVFSDFPAPLDHLRFIFDYQLVRIDRVIPSPPGTTFAQTLVRVFTAVKIRQEAFAKSRLDFLR